MPIENPFVWITVFLAPFVSLLVLLALKRNMGRLGQLPYLVAMSEILMVLLYSSDDPSLTGKGVILMTFSMVFVAFFALILPGAAKEFRAEYLDLPQKRARKITENLLLDKGQTIAYSKTSPLMFEAPSKFGRVRGKVTFSELGGKTLVGVESTLGISALTFLAIISLVGLFLSGMVLAFKGAGIEEEFITNLRETPSLLVFPFMAGVLTLLFAQNTSRICSDTAVSLDKYLVDKATQIIMAQHVAQRVLTTPKRSKKEAKLQELEAASSLAAKLIKKSEGE